MFGCGGRRAFLVIALALVMSVYAVAARAADHACEGPTNLTHLERPLIHVGERLAAHEPIKIVAIGSSSTAGAGASLPAASYPSRLAVELSKIYPDVPITVLNRGINGHDVEQFRGPKTVTILAPPQYKTGELIYPYTEARK